jgi:hypothetical protein
MLYFLMKQLELRSSIVLQPLGFDEIGAGKQQRV